MRRCLRRRRVIERTMPLGWASDAEAMVTSAMPWASRLKPHMGSER